MKKETASLLSVIVLLFFSNNSELLSQPSADVETGFVNAVYNNVRIPGDNGTKVSFTDDLSSSASFFFRLRAGYTIRDRHNVSLLLAPLSVKSDGFLPYDLSFNGITFPADSMLDAGYRFNSYRITYRYDLVLNDRIEFGLGLTGKIRDAAITVRTPGHYSKKTNIGFVPLINFRFLVNMDERLSFIAEGDALAAPQGRAEDILLAFRYKISDAINMRVGYRILEGGADNDEVYNFSMFSYGTMGFTYSFNK